MDKTTYLIGDLARISGVSVRMLRHYDHLGLLVPSCRTEAGYRQYSGADLLRLQQILVCRSLGLALEDIRELIDSPNLDRRSLLIQQRQTLVARAKVTANMIRSIDKAIELLENSTGEMIMEMGRLFEGFDPKQYEQEVQERWGNTDAYSESKRRTKKYTPETYDLIKQESDTILSALAEKLDSGANANDGAVLALAEQYRLHIDRWFYPCSHAMHCSLAEMYEADERFANNINNYKEGLTPFLVAAIRGNRDFSNGLRSD